MMREVAFGSRRIRYSLTYSRRRTLAIAVHADQRVTVRAPVGASPDMTDARVAKHGALILRWMRRGSAQTTTSGRRYVSGATVRLFGRDLTLRVRRAQQTQIVLDRPYLRVFTSDDREAVVEALVVRWLWEKARVRLAARIGALAPRILGRDATVPKWRLVVMTKRWGSCSRRGTISLNPWLVEHAAGCVDYVVLHELCHVRFRGHGREFQSLLSRLLPDWRRWKRRLDGGSTL